MDLSNISRLVKKKYEPARTKHFYTIKQLSLSNK